MRDTLKSADSLEAYSEDGTVLPSITASELIHYHGLPMTPVADMLRVMRGRHAMVSFEHPQQIEEAAEVCQSVALDNGAFTAWRAHRTHDFEGYAQWAEKWLRHPCVEWCVIPDVIDGDERANDRLLDTWPLDIGFSVPVYHLHESLDRLERLLGIYGRIALGSSGVYAHPGSHAWWTRIAEIMEVACAPDGLPRRKLHGLRMLDPALFSHLPLASADSCNVARNIGIDQAWTGPYVPRSRQTRALVLMDRIEHHASARRWSNQGAGVQQSMELIG